MSATDAITNLDPSPFVGGDGLGDFDRSAYEVVQALTGAMRQVATVTAIVVTKGQSPFLAHTLDALQAQTRPADHILVVDADAMSSATTTLVLRPECEQFVAGLGARSFGAAVDRAIRHDQPDGWLWLLHDDSAPAPDALSKLLAAVEHADAVAVAGCKQRRWQMDDDGAPLVPFTGGQRLIEVGHTVSPLGRRMTGIDDTEIDQGQHDARDDVLAVGLAGALVRSDVWHELRGTNSTIRAFGDGLDFCRRVHRAGHRVVVVPEAVVYHAQASLLGLRKPHPPGQLELGTDVLSLVSYQARRRSQLHHRLVHCPALLLLPALLGMLLWAPVAAMRQLANGHPIAARAELSAPWWNLTRCGAVLRARRGVARVARLPRRALAPLLASWSAVYRERRDIRLARAEAARLAGGPTDLERQELRRIGARRRGGLALVLLSVTALSVWAFGPLISTLAGGGHLAGGALLPGPASAADTWRAAVSSWVPLGLGVAAPADPLLVPLAGLAALFGGSLQLALNLLFLTALPVAALGGWFAAGGLTRVVWARALAVLAWALSPALLEGIGSGRLGFVLAHLTLPWFVLALIRTVGAQVRDEVTVPGDADERSEEHAGLLEAKAPLRSSRVRRGSLAAACAAGLLLAVVVAGVPVLMPVAVIAVLVGLVVAPRSRWLLPVTLVPSLVIGAPFWVYLLRLGPSDALRLLLAEPGGSTTAGTAPAGWQMLLGWPDQPVLGEVQGIVTLAFGALIVAGALFVLIRSKALVAVRIAWLLAGFGLALASLTVANQIWPGVGVSVTLLGLSGAALLGIRETQLRTATKRWASTLVVAAALLPLVGGASWILAVSGPARIGEVTAHANPAVPAAGRAMQVGDRQARVLQLDFVGGEVTFALLSSESSSLLETSVAARLARYPASIQPVAEVAGLAAAGVDTGVVERMAELGIGAVQVPAGGDAGLITALDLTPGLERVTEGDRILLWRVAPSSRAVPSWARVGDDVVPATDFRIDTQLASTRGIGDSLVIAATPHLGWRATLDGAPLTDSTVSGLQSFDLPAGGGHLQVSHMRNHQALWVWGGTVIIACYVVLALPVRRKGVAK